MLKTVKLKMNWIQRSYIQSVNHCQYSNS